MKNRNEGVHVGEDLEVVHLHVVAVELHRVVEVVSEEEGQESGPESLIMNGVDHRRSSSRMTVDALKSNLAS